MRNYITNSSALPPQHKSIMPYSEIEDIFINFARVAIDYIKSNLPNGTLEQAKVKRTIFEDNGWYDIDVEMYWQWQGLPIDWMRELSSKSETQQYIEFQNSELSYEIQLHELILPLLDAIYQKISLTISDKELLEKYSIHRTGWMNKEKHEYHYIPLINFTADCDVKITDNLSIKAFPNDLKSEFNIFYRSSPDEFDLSTWDLSESKFMIRYKNTWKIGEEKPIGKKQLTPLVSALRLLKKGNIGTKSRMVKSKENAIAPSLFSASGGPVGEYYTPRNGSKYHLTAKDIPDVKKKYHQLSLITDSKKYKLLHTPLSRFHIAYTRTKIVDQILDYSIALESLLLSGNTTELLYRMRMRASWLLRNTYPPEKTRKFIQAFYDMRSCIVHRGFSIEDILANTKIINKLTEYYEEIIEKTIKEFIDELIKNILLAYIDMLKIYKSIHEINTKIDEGITSW